MTRAGPSLRRRSLLASAGALAVPHRAAAAEEAVDLVLVLAVDVSRSIDEEEARLQREGYQAAMADPRVVAAIGGGAAGAIAVAYVEWAGYTYQRLVVPWMRVATAADAAAWSARLGRAPRESMSWTSLSGALAFSRRVLAVCPYEAARRVVDVSGDGANNSGPSPEEERDRLVDEGVVINGLPIVNDRPNFGVAPGPELEPYYREFVIGGPGAFLVVAEDFASFGDAIRRKLVQEIAGGPAVPPAGG